ncbi:MAG: hypothetical protein HYV76_00740 [Candidatus Vogelbacteria bacterium]|nr:hypothetical protein [Candidatus Vogelbacteria bacterium]
MTQKAIKSKFGRALLIVAALIGLILISSLIWPSTSYVSGDSDNLTVAVTPSKPRHLPTPDPLRAVYMTSWVAGTASIREPLINLIDQTEINAVVIDVKDYTGIISFTATNTAMSKYGSMSQRILDIEGLIKRLHEKNIYVIARISVFQDSHLSKTRPDLAVIRASDGEMWRDHKGVSWLDQGSHEVWDYTVMVGKMAEQVGFDELNFDYIRFPSDGNMQDIAYRFYNSNEQTKPEALESFFKYLDEQLSLLTIPISADLFGMTTTNNDDLGIGQVWERALPHFDYLAPMIYPSHYPPTFNGFANPAEHPYAMIKIAAQGAIDKTVAASSTVAKIRPWLQDFSLGADYTAKMIEAQKQALYDLGINSWMMWDPSNKYTNSAYQLNIATSTAP